MDRRRFFLVAFIVLGPALMVWAIMFGVGRLVSTGTPPPPPPASLDPPSEATSVAHINATLFYASEAGILVPVRREVPLAEGRVAQGRAIVMAQLGAAPSPYLSVIPEGTTLRSFYLTDRGDAFVDLSPEASSNHPGGSTAELLTVQAIVHAVTTNLSAVSRVQILIDGMEVDTLAGHVDLRSPLARDASLLQEARNAESQ